MVGPREPGDAPRVALLYDDDAYVEVVDRPSRSSGRGALGLFGRHVAGKAFLDSYLAYGAWDDLVVILRDPRSRAGVSKLFETYISSRPTRPSPRFILEREFHRRFFPHPPATVLYTGWPPRSGYAWARHHGGPGSFALSGVTHTICSVGQMSQLCEYVTSPFEPFDALICTSRAVAQTVRSVTSAYIDYLRDRHGGAPSMPVRIETIPLGVDTARYRPPAWGERAAQRDALGIAEDEVVILFVGRLSFHSKAHPYPMLRAVAEAARTTGARVRLIIAGWAVNDVVLRDFTDGARTFAPDLQVSFADGMDPELRHAIWRAADVFTSLADSVQETFGLVVIEAMACGLPVVATDWDGYRDLILDGETGYLVPTTMVADATTSVTSRFLLGEMNYDFFLAECSQAVAIDIDAAAQAYARLIVDAPLRRRLGSAGRRRAVGLYAWPHIIRAYEELWRDQEAHRRACTETVCTGRGRTPNPSAFPPPEYSFASYPSQWLGEEAVLETMAGADNRVELLMSLPLTGYSSTSRVRDATIIRQLLDTARGRQTIGDLDRVLTAAGVPRATGRATLAWMLKYGLLRVVTL